MSFQAAKLKNMVMPARHISSESFDEILSELGDDPAIPDPHGIRKPRPQQSTPRVDSVQSNHRSFFSPFSKLQIPSSIQNLGGLITLFFGVLIVVAVVSFFTYIALDQSSKSAQEESQKLISELKKEIAFMRNEFHENQEDLYMAIEEIEVSIHSLMNRKPEIKVSSRPAVPSHETELRRWRYLGAAQMGDSHQAFFSTGKGNAAFEKGARVLGDWQLNSIESGMATFSHPQGKSLALKTPHSE
ncbi:hypothetical protein [Polynucleobacter sp. KF022]|uniref:hypothetical protein n=1 Tax=Polynucleobacter sp. KF022 TaxID=2982615 RepID=UPI002493B854|nr:hypothetical protein [Polynucleobacter sp. KF022]